jgi:hypothetical protein
MGIQTSQVTTAENENLVLEPAGSGRVTIPDLLGSGELPISVDNSGSIKELDEREFASLSDLNSGDLIMVQRGSKYYSIDASYLGGFNVAVITPEDIEWTPTTPPGSGSAGNPFVLSPLTVPYVGLSAYSTESCRILNQLPDAVVLVEEVGGVVGSRMNQNTVVVESDGNTAFFHFDYVDAPESTSAQIYNGVINVGGIYVKWDVTQLKPVETIFEPKGSPNASPSTVDYSFDQKYGKVSATWADGDKTLASTGNLLFRVNGGAFTFGNLAVTTGDTVEIGYVESAVDVAQEGDTISGNLVSTDGLYSSSHSMVKNTTPDQFVINPLFSQPTSSVATSGNNPLLGVNAPTTISIVSSTLTNVELSIAGSSFSSGPWTFNPGDTLQARGETGSQINTTFNAIFNVGGVSATWNVTTTSGSPSITQPSIFSPTNGTNISPPVTLVATTYLPLDAAGSHANSDWEIFSRPNLKTQIGPIIQQGLTTSIQWEEYVKKRNLDSGALVPYDSQTDSAPGAGNPTNIFGGDKQKGWQKTTPGQQWGFWFEPPNPIWVETKVGVKAGFNNQSKSGFLLINGNQVLRFSSGDGADEAKVVSVEFTGYLNTLELRQEDYPGSPTDVGGNHGFIHDASFGINQIAIDGEALLSNIQTTYLDFGSNEGFDTLNLLDPVKETNSAGVVLNGVGVIGEIAPDGYPNRILLSQEQSNWSAGSFLRNENSDSFPPSPPSSDIPSSNYTVVDRSLNDATNKESYPVSSLPSTDTSYFTHVRYKDDSSSGSVVSSPWSSWTQLGVE